MNAKNITLLVIVIGFFGFELRGFAGPSSAPSGSGAILSGQCSAGGISKGIPQVVWGLGENGQVQCGFLEGPPVRGIPMPSGGTLANLRVTDDPSDIGSVTNVYVNGQLTTLTCAEDSTGKCADTTHRVAVRGGDEVALTFTSTSGNLTNAGVIMSLEKR